MLYAGIGSRCYSPRIGGVLDSNQLVTKGIISFGLAFIGAYLVLEQEKVLIFHNMWAYSNM